MIIILEIIKEVSRGGKASLEGQPGLLSRGDLVPQQVTACLRPCYAILARMCLGKVSAQATKCPTDLDIFELLVMKQISNTDLPRRSEGEKRREANGNNVRGLPDAATRGQLQVYRLDDEHRHRFADDFREHASLEVGDIHLCRLDWLFPLGPHPVPQSLDFRHGEHLRLKQQQSQNQGQRRFYD